MNFKIIFLIIFLNISTVYSQKEYNNWYFGQKAGITFNTSNGEPAALLDGQMDTGEGCSVISDKNGSLLFYTDGRSVWNRKHQLMKNGTGLYGHSSSTQSALIVPKPGSDKIYYIFTNDAYEAKYLNGFNYSIVDLTLDKGFGDVTQKNIHLLDNRCERLTAIEHSNRLDIWIITQNIDEKCFESYLLTEKGLENYTMKSPSTILKNLLAINPLKNTPFQLGVNKFSPNGKKLVCVNYSNDTVFFYDFNKNSGKFSNEMPLLVSNKSYSEYYDNYGAEFSDNGQFLYISGGTGLFQFDVTSNNQKTIQNSLKKISKSDNNQFWGMEMGPNKKIYITSQKEYLSVINEPNKSGTACNLKVNNISLGGRLSIFGLPALVKNYLGVLNNSDSISVCENDSLSLIPTYYNEAMYKWSGPNGFISNEYKPVIKNPIVSMSGKYEYTISKDGNFLGNGSIFLIVNPREKILFSDLTEIFYCEDSLELTAVNNPEKCDITWKGINSKDNTVIIKKEGQYSVYVRNEFGCVDSASVFVYKFGKNISVYEKQHNFDIVKTGSMSEFKFTIENNEAQELTVQNIYIKNQTVHFELIHTSLPFIIKSNEKTEIKVNFIPKFDVNIADSVVIIFSEPCNITDYVTLSGSGEGNIEVDIWMPDTTAEIGTRDFKMPLYVKLHDNGNAVFTTDISAKISFLRTLYNAKSLSIGQYLVETLQDSLIYNVEFKDVLVSNKTNNFFEFTGDILFAKENFTDMKFDKLEFSNPDFTINYKNGSIKVNHLCVPEIKGIKVRNGTYLSLKKEIYGILAKVFCGEAGEYKFSIFSVSGETVYNNSWITNSKAEKYFNLSDLVNSSGLYFIMLNSEKETSVQNVTIIK